MGQEWLLFCGGHVENYSLSSGRSGLKLISDQNEYPGTQRGSDQDANQCGCCGRGDGARNHRLETEAQYLLAP